MSEVSGPHQLQLVRLALLSSSPASNRISALNTNQTPRGNLLHDTLADTVKQSHWWADYQPGACSFGSQRFTLTPGNQLQLVGPLMLDQEDA